MAVQVSWRLVLLRIVFGALVAVGIGAALFYWVGLPMVVSMGIGSAAAALIVNVFMPQAFTRR